MADVQQPLIPLDESDRNSQTWRRLKALAEHELAVDRSRLEGDLDDKETAKVRGSIRRLKWLLALGEPKKDLKISKPGYT